MPSSLSRLSMPLPVQLLGRLAMLAAAITGLVSSLGPTEAAAQPLFPSQASFIRRAVFAEGRLWLLDDLGVLSSTAPADRSRKPEASTEVVQDICLTSAGRLLTVTGAQDAQNLTIRQRVGGEWKPLASFPARMEGVVALSCAGPKPVVLTSKRLLEIEGDHVTTVLLAKELPGHDGITSVALISGALLVGINEGEFGGGLLRIDPQQGTVTRIERNASGELCAGPLNTECDPVNGIVAEPWRPDCTLLAIGLVHFSPHGRLTEICGAQIESLFFAPYKLAFPPPPKKEPKDKEPFSTVAFFGLQRQGDILWAIGIDGLYRVTQKSVEAPVRLPKFSDRDGVAVSFKIPHLALVLTNVNQRRSLSGATPLLVAY